MDFIKSEIIDLETVLNPVDKYELLEVIGEGTYGQIFLAIDLLSGTENKVAVKIVENLVENFEEVENEYLVLSKLTLHPNLPRFYGLCYEAAPRLENSQIWFVMEYCSAGSATDLVQTLRKFESRTLTEKQLTYILHEVIDALIHLHENNVIHLDVKGHNILFTTEGRVKLIDFGLSAHLSSPYEKRNQSVGTPLWMSPEVIACDHHNRIFYDSRCDVWSLGITAIELAEGEPPLADMHPMRALFQIPRYPPPTLAKPSLWSALFIDFVGDCLIKNIEVRPWISEVKNHPFISSLGYSADLVRNSIALELELVKALRHVRREPEVTMQKDGKLRFDRKSAPELILVDDLASLSNPNEETVLEQLRRRFEQRQIYTFIGEIVLVVNPYADLRIYSEFYQFKYRGSSTMEVAPHIFGVADQIYQTMLHQKKDQVLILMGESGSGKTETMKHLIKQFVFLGKAPNRNLETKVLQVNPIMEAFGNAKTGTNQNASRFVNYLYVTFTRTGKVTGAEVSAYLLEESRVIHQGPGEGGFHIFYYILHGLAKEGSERSQLFKSSYRYLSNFENASQDQQAEYVRRFHEVHTGLIRLGFTAEEIFSIFEILVGILHLGEICFETDDDNESCSVKNLEDLQIASSFLGISSGELGIALTTSQMTSSSTENTCDLRSNSMEEAISMRDSLAKTIYTRLFQGMINQINALLGIGRAAFGAPHNIGILDVFGFQTSQKNSFEHLIMNTVNEELQHYYNQHIFNWEQQEYMAEEIDIEIVKFADNRPILNLLLQRPLGVFQIIDDESLRSKATGESLKDQLDRSLGDQKYYWKSKNDGDLCFDVRHYARKTRYNVESFLEKNRRRSIGELEEILKDSKNETMRILFRSTVSKSGRLHVSNRRKSSIALHGPGGAVASSRTKIHEMRYALAELLSKLLIAQPRFILCILPNSSKKPNLFDDSCVLKQVKYASILDTMHLRRIGFSHHFTFVNLLKSYCFLGFNFDERVLADQESCRLLLLRLKLDGWAIGNTKVFLRYYHVEYLAKLYESQIRKIIFVQSCIRRWLSKIRLEKGMWTVAKQVVSAQKAAKLWKGHTAMAGSRKRLNKKRRSWLRIQILGIEEEDSIDIKTEEEKAAIVIQSHFRGFLVRKKWGPILEERIKEIVSTQKTQDSANEALLAEGLSEEEAAQVLQRYYRRWKLVKQISLEQETVKRPPSPKQEWDAPFRLIEFQKRERREGRKRIGSTNLDLSAHTRELLRLGLVSQKLKNEQRDATRRRGWKTAIRNAGIEIHPLKKQFGTLVSGKFGKKSQNSATEVKPIEEDENLALERPETESKLMSIPESISDRNVLNASNPAPDLKSTNRILRVKSFPIETAGSGPVDFRSLLKKTGISSTDSDK